MNTEKYKVVEQVSLENFKTLEKVNYAKKELQKVRKEISDLQEKMYAEGRYAMLVCIQGMDTSGKDSLIREIFKDVNARGVEVSSFKEPTELELEHDFMWRHYVALPPKGKIGVFNRTHYENVLVTRVRPEYIFKENIPTVNSLDDLDDAFYYSRMERMLQFEEHLVKNGTIVLKFFLNISKEEQKKRLLRRLERPDKNWKFSESDLKERKKWSEYQKCYEDVLNKTSTEKAPWFIVPSDNKPTSRLIVAKTILKEMKKCNFKEPMLDQKHIDELNDFETQLKKEK